MMLMLMPNGLVSDYRLRQNGKRRLAAEQSRIGSGATNWTAPENTLTSMANIAGNTNIRRKRLTVIARPLPSVLWHRTHMVSMTLPVTSGSGSPTGTNTIILRAAPRIILKDQKTAMIRWSKVGDGTFANAISGLQTENPGRRETAIMALVFAWYWMPSNTREQTPKTLLFRGDLFLHYGI